MKKICVLGLGYIGLPTASMFAMHGMQVLGVDINAKVIATLNQGNIHIDENGLKEAFLSAISSGNLTIKEIPEPSDVFIIAVPTPITGDKRADMQAVVSATEAIVPFLQKGNLVIVESTSPPRTTVDLVKPILEQSQLNAGEDFLLAYSPERVLPGNILHELVENARVIGGINRESAEAGRDLYATFVKGEILLTDATTAEFVKLMENTYRDVNIALANEFALLSERIGINVWEAITIANRHPRVKILKPGPGVGGHCIAVDPWFLVESAPDLAALIRQARLINDRMPDHVVEMVKSSVGQIKNAKIACLGLTYKADVDDVRESPALEVVEKLILAGFQVSVYDPYVHCFKTSIHPVNYLAQSLANALMEADLLLILVDHKEFKNLKPDDLINMRGCSILDTRYCIDLTIWQNSRYEVKYLGKANG